MILARARSDDLRGPSACWPKAGGGRTIWRVFGRGKTIMTARFFCALVWVWSSLGCGRLVIGVGADTGDGSADTPPPKPAAISAWEPRSVDPHAHITAARVGADFAYVGFSDGEIYYQPTPTTPTSPTPDAGPSWLRMDLTDNIGGQLTPRMPVTSIVIDVLEGSPSIMVGYAGESGAHTFWCAANNGKAWLELPLSNDVWSLSVSPFQPADIAIVTDSLTWAALGCGTPRGASAPGTFDINFAGSVEAFAEGTGPGGARRAWLGDSSGGVYYADNIDAVPSPAGLNWTAVRDPGFPHRAVTAIAVNRAHPARIWVTFRGFASDDLWSSADNGLTWRNQRRDFLTTPPGASAGSLTAVSLVPSLDLAYVSALVSEVGGRTTASSFWTVGDGQPWSPE